MRTVQPETLPLDDETQIYCDVGLHGWSDLIIKGKGAPMILRVSDVFTDFPSEMLEICRAALQNISLRVALCDEPGGAILELKQDKKQQHTVILVIYEIVEAQGGFVANEVGKPVFTTRLRRQRLIAMIMADLWKTHVSLRQPSYQEGRAGFPHEALVALNKQWHRSALGPSFLNN